LIATSRPSVVCRAPVDHAHAASADPLLDPELIEQHLTDARIVVFLEQAQGSAVLLAEDRSRVVLGAATRAGFGECLHGAHKVPKPRFAGMFGVPRARRRGLARAERPRIVPPDFLPRGPSRG
jgi:hypothetical protein